MSLGDAVSASDWAKGIGLSVVASLVGGASKLAIRKSWLIEHADGNRAENGSSIESDTPETLTLNIGDHHEGSLLTSADPTRADTRYPRYVPLTMRYSGMFGMTVLNPICCVLAMNFASPSILAPFSGLTLVWVILFSHPVVGEKPSKPQVVAACLIIVGEVIVALFGDHTNDSAVTVEDVRKSYQEPIFIAYIVGVACYVSLLSYWIMFSKRPLLRRFAWGSCGGAITGLQNFLKDSLTIIKAMDAGQSYPWFLYLFFALAAATGFIGLLFLTSCMKRYDATYSAASFVGSFVVSASIMSAAHYNTFAYLESTWNYILYPVGLGVLMFGVFILVRETRDSDEEDDEFETFVGPVRKNSEDSQWKMTQTSRSSGWFELERIPTYEAVPDTTVHRRAVEKHKTTSVTSDEIVESE